ncbi:TetR/AcrR family transcriptional regulator [Sphingopyxis sp.]|jgi:AcrR family transcriptional regulator|uniref:TetR/AcrR family transcriptional regulator n=1 Tax=Sphingopyxis sp. TaxID=1908224 RepID=UPI0025D3103C|nr:TetR/AcrR family transcriptional regulator [Sphingopyxis sp.]MBK6413040.1 TetR/AcrR family transcriptional regulator [Sphingopyxis sp.]
MARPRVGTERREQILAAFEACVIRSGFAKTTLADVAEEAGQQRSLVRYFIGNREDMIGALIDRLLERAEAQLQAIPENDSVEQVLTLLFEHVFDDPTTNAVIMELWYLALRDARLRQRLASVYEILVIKVSTLATAEQEHDRAFAAVSLAFGSAFFRYLGLRPNSPDNLRSVTRHLLAEPLSQKGKRQ